MYTERWRKKYKKAQRHWFITELGHKNSERIHLHGIIWNTTNTSRKEFKKDIAEKWQYGNVYIGEYVNEKTINYITKYITKLDNFHKGYKQKITTSKKIGQTYINSEEAKRNQYRGARTNSKNAGKRNILRNERLIKQRASSKPLSQMPSIKSASRSRTEKTANLRRRITILRPTLLMTEIIIS